MSNYFIKEEPLKKWAWGGIFWQYNLWDVEEQLDSCHCVSVIQKLSCFIEQQMWHTINCVHYQPPPHPAPASTHPQIPPTWPHECLARNYNSQSPLLLPVIMWLNSCHRDKWKLCVQLLGHLLKDVEMLALDLVPISFLLLGNDGNKKNIGNHILRMAEPLRMDPWIMLWSRACFHTPDY